MVLLTAFDYTADSRADPWQLAIELPELVSNGATLNDIRWLILRKFAEHAKETTIPGDSKRSFRSLAQTYIPHDTCLVLSADGAATIRFALGLQSTDIRQKDERLAPKVLAVPRAPLVRITPEWDETRRELRFDGQVIKRYRVPARNQALVLATFQELDWPEVIDDPLPPEGAARSKATAPGHYQIAQPESTQAVDTISRQWKWPAGLVGTCTLLTIVGCVLLLVSAASRIAVSAA